MTNSPRQIGFWIASGLGLLIVVYAISASFADQTSNRAPMRDQQKLSRFIYGARHSPPATIKRTIRSINPTNSLA